MDDHRIKQMGVVAGLGAAVGVGIALGIGLRTVATSALVGIGVGAAIGLAAALKGRDMRVGATVIDVESRPVLH